MVVSGEEGSTESIWQETTVKASKEKIHGRMAVMASDGEQETRGDHGSSDRRNFGTVLRGAGF